MQILKKISTRNPRIIDAFLFYNELDMLNARLDFLGPFVDFFIISEANVDFSGKPKEFLITPSILEKLPYKEKVIYHREYIHFNSLKWIIKRIRYHKRRTKFLWKIQDAQRNSTLKPLAKFNNNDFIIFGDLDEFPSERALTLLKNRDLPNVSDPKFAMSCDQLFFYYNLKNCAVNEKWYGSIFTTLYYFRKKLPQKIRSFRDSLPHIHNGGWHLSYFMPPGKIKDKVQAIAEVERLDSHYSMSENEIEAKINQNLDLFDREISFKDKIGQEINISNRLEQCINRYLPYCK